MQLNTRTPASFPSHPQQPRTARRPHSKARSISSLPNSARGSPILPSSVNSGPGRLYTAAREYPTRQRSPTIHSPPGMPSAPSMPHMAYMTTSPRQSPRSRTIVNARGSAARTPSVTPNVQSPSKLPATDCMSYFPPFESMGSADPNPDESASAGPSRVSEQAGKETAGKNRSRGSTPDSKRTSSSHSSQRHGKVRSLGSLGGFISAWASFSPATTPMGAPSAAVRSESDGMAVDALANRTSVAKRRTLEPVQSETFMDWERNVRRSHSRRQTVGENRGEEGPDAESEGQRQRPHLSLPALPSWRNPMPSPPVVTLSPDIPTELFHVEISNPASSNSSPYKNATLPPSHLSFLRRLTTGGSYPASLSGDDSDAYSDADAASPIIEQCPRMDDDDAHNNNDGEIEAVEAGLSPTSAYASLSGYSTESRPITPASDADETIESEELDDDLVRLEHYAYVHEPISNANYYTTSIPIDRKSKSSMDAVDRYFLDPARYSLHRTDSASSGRSCDSKETIRPSAVLGKGSGQEIGIGSKRAGRGGDGEAEKQTVKTLEGEVTPRTGKRPAFEIGSD